MNQPCPNMSYLINPSQIICRNFKILSDCHTIIMEAPADSLAAEWQQQFSKPLDLFTTNYIDFIHHQNQQLSNKQIFAHKLPAPETPYEQAILFWPKSKALAHYLLKQLAAVLAPGAALWLVGENRGGVRSGTKKLPQGFAVATKQDAAKHCSLFHSEMVTPKTCPEEADDQHWFSLQINDVKIEVCSYPGVFNHGQLDPGTKLLLDQQQPGSLNKLLDVGCGAGIIASYYGLKQPACELTLCDVNAMALEATRQTLAANGLTGTVAASDVFSDINGKFDLIVSNPPFHQGLDTNYDIARRLVVGAHAHLRQSGALRIVANSFLKYPALLADHFPNPQVLANDRKFKVYHVQM